MRAVPGLPLLSYHLRGLSLAVFGDRNRLTVAREEAWGTDSFEAYSVFLGGLMIGRCVVERDYGRVERRFLAMVPDDFPIPEIRDRHLSWNASGTIVSDRLRISLELAITAIFRFIENGMLVINPVALPPKTMNEKLNRAVADGSMTEYGTRILNMLLIPVLRPDVIGVADSYGPRSDFMLGIPPMYTDRRGKVYINVAVAVFCTPDIQFIMWLAERVIYPTARRVVNPVLNRVVQEIMGGTARLVALAPRFFVVLFFKSDRLLAVLVALVIFGGTFFWRYRAKRLLIKAFHAMGGDIASERKKLILDRVFSSVTPDSAAS